MMKHMVIIDRPPEVVWPFVADPANLTSWNSKILEAQGISTGAVGPGYRFQMKYQMGSRVDSAVAEVVAFDPPRYLELHVTGERIGRGGHVRETYTLSPEGDGTWLEQVIDLRDSGIPWFVRGLLGVLQRTQRRRGSKYLQRLKSLIESA